MANDPNSRPARSSRRRPLQRSERGSSEALPLAVWPVAQTSIAEQRVDRYLATTVDTAELMPPVLAARIVATYCRAGLTVCDVMCGTGTVLAEAARTGRQVVGLDLDAEAAHTAALNIAVARLVSPTDGAAPVGGREIVCADARSAVDVITGRSVMGLVVMHPPRPGTRAPGRPDDPDLATRAGAAYWEAITEVAAAVRALIVPGGHLVIVVRGYQRGGEHVDSASMAVAAARHAGWTYLQHVIAVRAPLRGDRIHPPSTTEQRFPRRRSLIHHVVHDNVLAFAADPHGEVFGDG